MFPSITPEMFAGSPIEEAYLRTAPNPGDFPKLVEKLTRLDTTPFAWPADDIRGIAAPDADRRSATPTSSGSSTPSSCSGCSAAG